MKKAPASHRSLPSARLDFHKAVRKIVEDHPVLGLRAVFINAQTNEWNASKKVLEDVFDDLLAQSEIERTIRDARRLKTSFIEAVKLDTGATIRAIIFYPGKNLVYDPANRLIDDTGSLDHETGHALWPRAGDRLEENVADAYAVIRRLQRFGVTEKHAGYCGWRRAVDFMQQGFPAYLTTFTVDKIVVDKETADFMSLSPSETAALARDYARQHTPGNKALQKLADDFSVLKKKTLTKDTFRKLAAITLAAPAASGTFYVGARILSGPLQEGGVTLDGKNIQLKGGEWPALRQRLAQKIAALPAKHPLGKVLP